LCCYRQPKNYHGTKTWFATPNENFMRAPTTPLDIVAEQYEIKPHFATMAQQDQFGGTASEDVDMHLHNFIELCDLTY
jgi:hypothetical protein